MGWFKPFSYLVSPLVGTVTSAVGLGSEAVTAVGNSISKSNRELADRMKAEMDGLKSEEKQRKSDEKFQADSIMMRDAQKQRQKSLASAAQGRSGTILTGPIGITTQANAGTKTLLGS